MLVAQFCLTPCNPMDYSPPGSSVHGILQARILEWVVISLSSGSSWPRDWTCICTAGGFFTCWTIRAAPIWKAPSSALSAEEHKQRMFTLIGQQGLFFLPWTSPIHPPDWRWRAWGVPVMPWHSTPGPTGLYIRAYVVPYFWSVLPNNPVTALLLYSIL